jgi:hypothetical protein
MSPTQPVVKKEEPEEDNPLMALLLMNRDSASKISSSTKSTSDSNFASAMNQSTIGHMAESPDQQPNEDMS